MIQTNYIAENKNKNVAFDMSATDTGGCECCFFIMYSLYMYSSMKELANLSGNNDKILIYKPTKRKPSKFYKRFRTGFQ